MCVGMERDKPVLQETEPLQRDKVCVGYRQNRLQALQEARWHKRRAQRCHSPVVDLSAQTESCCYQKEIGETRACG